MTKHVLLTGFPGVGKTTLVQKVCYKLKSKGANPQGFYTEEIRTGNHRIGFDVFTLSGKQGCLARLGGAGCKSRGPRVGKYAVDIASFEDTALPCFDVTTPKILVIDEIGKMELLSEKFQEAVQVAFNTPGITVFATVPLRSDSDMVRSLKQRADITLITVTEMNRDDLLPHLEDLLSD